MDEIERSVNEVNRMLGDPDDINTSGVPTSRKGGTRSKVIHNRKNISIGKKMALINVYSL